MLDRVKIDVSQDIFKKGLKSEFLPKLEHKGNDQCKVHK